MIARLLGAGRRDAARSDGAGASSPVDAETPVRPRKEKKGKRVPGASTGLHPGGGADRIPREVARRIRLAIFDVDGVLTDAGVYLGEDAEGRPVELKRFDIQDGLGLTLLREAGIQLALVSGRVSAATVARARELGIGECHQEPGARKLPVVEGILTRLDLDWGDVAMLGDDLPDLPVFRRVGLPVAVGNAVSEVRREALWTTRREGGHGAVREFSKRLLQARGEWDSRVEAYIAARSGPVGEEDHA